MTDTTGRPLRVLSIDVVRGAAMVLMALDHVRDFVTNIRFQPEDLARGSAALFATRWVTHFCAPAFFLLAGLGIGISVARAPRPSAVVPYLLTRGMWLLFLELVLTPIGWQFDVQLLPAFALVLWALGWSMIVMAGLVMVSATAVGVVAVAMILGHNLLDPIRADAFGTLAGLWRVLHVPGFALPGVLLVGYPLIPWLGVMALGYSMARLYRWEAARRQKVMIGVGCAAIAAFVALRAVNGYGNPASWTPQRTPLLTAASFLNLLKYPPSAQFLLMTLGPILIALAAAERLRGPFARWLSVYGRAPLFFYVLHIFVAHATAVLLAFAQSGEWRRIPVVTNPASIPPWFGLSLPGVLLAWAVVVLLLYYPCAWIGRVKESRGSAWTRYV